MFNTVKLMLHKEIHFNRTVLDEDLTLKMRQKGPA